MKHLLAALILLAIAVGVLAEGEHFPIFVQDSSGNPVAGALVKAAIWGSRPPSYIGTATEQGNGAYYFRVGSSCGGCIPSGYYDLWRDGVLDSAYAGVYVGLGNVPPANSITSSHIVNNTVDLTQDVKQTYGTSSTRLTTVLSIQGATKDTTNGDNVINEITVDNSGTTWGRYPRLHLMDVRYNTDMSDSNDASMLYGGEVRSNQLHSTQSRFYVGPSGANFLVNAKRWGTGFMADVRNKGVDFGSHEGRHSRLTGAYVYVAGDSGSTYWNPDLSGNRPAGFEFRVHAHRMGEAWGIIGDIFADSSVAWVHGLHARVYGDGGSYPKIAYGAYTEAHGQGEAYGVKTMCKTYGKNPGGGGSYAFHGECDTDTTSGLAYAHGMWVSALSRPPEENQGHDKAWGVEAYAGADTAYGGYFEAYSDLDKASNFSRGVYAKGDGAPNNMGVLGVVDQAGNAYFSATNYGVMGWSRSGATNYGVYGRSTSPTTGATNYGVYGWADSAAAGNYAVYGKGGTDVLDWAGFFVGHVGADSVAIPPDAPAPSSGEKTRFRLHTSGSGNDVGLYVSTDNTSGTGIWLSGGLTGAGQYGLYLAGYAYPITQLAVNGVSVFNGTVSIAQASVDAMTFEDVGGAANCGLATVASGADTVRVSTSQCTAEADNIVHITARNRSPDGGTPYVVIRSGSFTIHCTTNQAANQEFQWTAYKR